jgi:oligo-1,6-glucosidase
MAIPGSNLSRRQWWKEAIIYQVYPRSFQDSDGDGIGDLRGLISRLDYIASLGIDAVWINPVYLSAGCDNGYDIVDFRSIGPEYGTMEDMQELIDLLHVRNIRIIMDMVLNHTSDRHEWFRQARTARDDPYYSFYHWWPAEKGEPPFRCGFFDATGAGWTFNEATNSWYLHYFSPRQPDLNWENPEVRRQLYDLLRFWLDKGIDGLRLDAICFIAKDTTWPVITPEILKKDYQNDWGNYYAAGEHLHEYLREMHEAVFSHYDVVTIGEASGISSDEALLFVDEDRKELDMLYHFEGITIGYLPGEFKKMDPAGYKLRDWKEVYSRWDEALGKKGWGSVYLGNHDQPRMLSHWGNSLFHTASAKLLFTFLLTQRATPFIYNGDELGMTNIGFDTIEDYRDIETRQMYQQIKSKGGNVDIFLRDQQLTGRDNSRTPFQWTGGPYAGFTRGEPWMTVNPNYTLINAALQEKDPDSILNYVRGLVRLRKQNPILVYGDYRLLTPDDPFIYAYTRSYAGDAWTILLNFSVKQQIFTGLDQPITLLPYQALILQGQE